MFELCNVRSDDDGLVAGVDAFLVNNPNPGVRIRPRPEMDRAMQSGHALALTQQNQICGCSLVYKFDAAPQGPIYSEIGTMRIVANGYGLQIFIAKFHLIQLYLEEYNPGQNDEVFAVVELGTASAHNLTKNSGFSLWQPPSVLTYMRHQSGVPFSSAKAVVRAEEPAFKAAFTDLAKWHIRDNLFRTPKGNEEILVNSGWFNPKLLQAHG